MLGGDGVTGRDRYAILNANYIKSRLEPHYPVLYTRPNGRVAHEMIFDLRPLKAAAGDRRNRRGQAPDGLWLPRADRLVSGGRTLMVEPTESEPRRSWTGSATR